MGCCYQFPKTPTTEGTRILLLPAHCLINLMRSQNRPIPEADVPPHEQYIVDVLLNVAKGSTPSSDHSKITTQPTGIKPCPTKQKGQPVIVPVLLSTIDSISHLRLVVPKDLRQDIAREHLWKSVLEVESRFPKGITLLDPIQHMGIKDDKFKELVKVFSSVFFCRILTKHTSRKFLSWKRKCFLAPFILLPSFLTFTPYIPRNGPIKIEFENSGSESKTHVMCFSLKNSNVVNVFFDGSISQILPILSMSKVV